MLIPSTKPLIALFHHGYLRLSMNEFNNDDSNLITHLTNQVRLRKKKYYDIRMFTKYFFFKFFQKKDPQYKEIKEDTTWSMDQFNDYVNNEVAPKKGLPADWVKNDLTVKNYFINCLSYYYFLYNMLSY